MPETLIAPRPGWRDRWSHEPGGTVVLDLGDQPASDLFPRPGDPVPDPRYPLRMVLGGSTGLLQLEDDPTLPEEPLGVEPLALVRLAEQCLSDADAAGFAPAGASFGCFPSPHGGSWDGLLTEHGLVAATGAGADLVVDVMGMMHAPDQRAAFEQRLARLGPQGVLLMVFHDAAAILARGMWHALRHGHFAYYSVPALVRMAEEIGLEAIGAWGYPLYGGTTMLALAHHGSSWGPRAAEVTRLLDEELASGVAEPTRAARLGQDFVSSVAALRRYLDDCRARGLRVAAYGAASRASALLCSAQVTGEDLLAVADAAPGKQGRTMPGSRIRIVAPAALTALHPDRVLLMVSDLLPEVRSALPEVEARGGRWTLLDPFPQELAAPGSVS